MTSHSEPRFAATMPGFLRIPPPDRPADRDRETEAYTEDLEKPALIPNSNSGSDRLSHF